MGLLDVNQDELLTIYSLLGKEQQNVFPLLCKAFAAILRNSGDLYRRLDVNIQDMTPVVTPGDAAIVDIQLADLNCWAQARAPYVRELSLRMTEGWETTAAETLDGILRACADLQSIHIRTMGGYKHWLPSIFALKHLRELSVTAGSTWVRLPPEFAHLTALERLNIEMRIEGGRQVAQSFVPIELLSCIRLRHLSFINCQGLFLPPVVGELLSLETLRVNHTDLADTRDAIHPCTFQRGSFSTFSLTSLDLTACNLDVLPFQMCHLEKLETLVLARNALSEMPRLLAAFLRRLRVVDLSCNNFKRIPPVLASLTCLHTVNLSGNQDLQVSNADGCAQQSMASRPAQRRLSLSQLVYALPELRNLDVRKHPHAHEHDRRRGDMWTPACYSCLAGVARAVRKVSPWCNLDTFLCDPIPMRALGG